MLYQLSHRANWEQVVIWVVYKPIDVEIDDTGIFHVFEMRIGLNECDHRIKVLCCCLMFVVRNAPTFCSRYGIELPE